MTRKEFIEQSVRLGFSLPILTGALFQSCGAEDFIFPRLQTSFSGKVLIVGAGAAGLSAGYLLDRHGIDFEIVEAAPVYGGRLKKIDGFADFPIDLGAEWIHTDPRILTDIVNTPATDTTLDIIVYNPQTIMSWRNNKLRSHNFINNFYKEWKFKSTTWFDFFERNVVPGIVDKIRLNKPVSEISYGTNKVVVKTIHGDYFEADKVLITTPIKMLQNRQISFQPPLPVSKTEAIDKVFVGDGIKIFVEFKERFYPDILAFGNIFRAMIEEEKFVYDAAFRKDSDKNVLGLFAINDKATPYTSLADDETIISKFLAELDEIFEGKATATYLKHTVQNWSKEPFIQGAYSFSFAGNQKSIVQTIQEPVQDKIYFAGEALSIDNQATVHGACESAYATIASMLKGL